jgi:predicted nuclease with TOPRIM domain
MIRKFLVSAKYPFIRRYDPDLSVELEKLRRKNEELRSKLVTAQQAKTDAVRRAESLRKEKDRLRSKIGSLKQEVLLLELKDRQLVTRIDELQEAVESLSIEAKNRKP